MEKKPKLVMMVGISGAGKTSIANDIAKSLNARVLSTDKIRESVLGDVNDQSKNYFVFDTLYKSASELIKCGVNVVLDCTNLKSKNRISALRRFKGIPCTKIAYIIAKPFEKCVLDNSNRERNVPVEVLQHQLSSFQIPFYEEGFDEIYIDREPGNFKSVDDIFSEMIGFDQKNEHHTRTLESHCEASAEPFKDDKVKYIAMKLHDYGKLFTQNIENANSNAKYYSHDSVGAYKIMTELDYGNLNYGELLEILFIINYHMSPYFSTATFINKKFGEKNAKLLFEINKADKSAK